jgi:hypothetical protein
VVSPAAVGAGPGQLSTPEEAEAEKRAWRERHEAEREDDAWTERMREDLARLARSTVRGAFGVEDLSCRATICRMYLIFGRKEEAERFIAGAYPAPLRHRSVAPGPDDQGIVPSTHVYEVLVERDP